jgi:hypothetical protein
VYVAETTAPVNYTTNSTNPGTGGSVDSPSQTTLNFAISIKELSEIAGNGIDIVRSIPVSGIKFTMVPFNDTMKTINNYGATLENGAVLNVLVSIFFQDFRFFKLFFRFFF